MCRMPLGLDAFEGDAVAIMMADQLDSPIDLVRYWGKLKEEMNASSVVAL